jgi:hypothetical protein
MGALLSSRKRSHGVEPAGAAEELLLGGYYSAAPKYAPPPTAHQPPRTSVVPVPVAVVETLEPGACLRSGALAQDHPTADTAVRIALCQRSAPAETSAGRQAVPHGRSRPNQPGAAPNLTQPGTRFNQSRRTTAARRPRQDHYQQALSQANRADALHHPVGAPAHVEQLLSHAPPATEKAPSPPPWARASVLPRPPPDLLTTVHPPAPASRLRPARPDNAVAGRKTAPAAPRPIPRQTQRSTPHLLRVRQHPTHQRVFRAAAVTSPDTKPWRPSEQPQYYERCPSTLPTPTHIRFRQPPEHV